MPISTRLRQTLLLVSALLGGCSMSPSMVIFGAAFPDWLFCITGAVIGTVVVHALLGEDSRERWLSPVAFSYPVVTALFAMSLWLAFFYR